LHPFPKIRLFIRSSLSLEDLFVGFAFAYGINGALEKVLVLSLLLNPWYQ
jgi:hypothetical protein